MKKYKRDKLNESDSIEKGISLRRAQELTKKSNPNVFQIRQTFLDMTSTEQKIVIKNMEFEINEIKQEIQNNLKLRKDVPADTKSIYTDKIGQWRSILFGKVDKLNYFKSKLR
jgi:hypothetical protein